MPQTDELQKLAFDTPEAPTFDPKLIEINPAQDTVEGRIQGIIDSARTGPVGQSLETRALQGMNTRGLANSSIALGEVEKQYYDHALPIAETDSGRSFQARTTNAGIVNQARELGATGQQSLQQRGAQGLADLQTQGGLIERKGEQDLILAQYGGEKEMILLNRRGEIDELLLNAEGDVKISLEKERGRIQKEIAEYQGQIELQLQDRKGEIEKELLMADVDGKIRLMDEEWNINRQLELLRTDNISRLEQERANIQIQLQDAELSNKLELQERQGQIDIELQKEQVNLEMYLQREQATLQTQLAEVDANSKIRILERQGIVDGKLKKLQGTIDTNLQIIQGNQAFSLQKLTGDQKSDLTKIEGDYKVLINNTDYGASIYSNFINSIGNVYAQDLTPMQTKAAIDDLFWGLNLAFSSAQTVYNEALDVTGGGGVSTGTGVVGNDTVVSPDVYSQGSWSYNGATELFEDGQGHYKNANFQPVDENGNVLEMVSGSYVIPDPGTGTLGEAPGIPDMSSADRPGFDADDWLNMTPEELNALGIIF